MIRFQSLCKHLSRALSANLLIALAFATSGQGTAAAGTAAKGVLKVDALAPDFTLKNQDGQPFNLAQRKGKGWTVLYFYPKAGTPGCTKQACAFRDSIKYIREKKAEVYGISADTVEAQKKFHTEHHLSFDLLADPNDVAIEAYGVKMPITGNAKRWTFILDPELVVRHIDDDVDPLLDAKKSAAIIEDLQKKQKGAPAP